VDPAAARYSFCESYSALNVEPIEGLRRHHLSQKSSAIDYVAFAALRREVAFVAERSAAMLSVRSGICSGAFASATQERKHQRRIENVVTALA
jgi:hypothetical protein